MREESGRALANTPAVSALIFIRRIRVVKQIDVHEFGSVGQLIGCGIHDVGAEPHGVSCCIIISVGMHIRLFLWRLGIMFQKQRSDAVGIQWLLCRRAYSGQKPCRQTQIYA